jgi:proteasome lid subunit RPN8/RPN11
MPESADGSNMPTEAEKASTAPYSAIWRAPSADIKAEIRQQAAFHYPNECCGLVVDVGGKMKVFPCRNIALDRKNEFMADPEDVGRAEDAGDVVMGYHSHIETGPTPSMADKVDAERNERPSLIVSWPADIWEFYAPTGWKAPLLGRPFVYGTLDCYTLARDWYAEEGLILPDFDRLQEGWWERQPDGKPKANLCMDNYTKAGFVIVNDLRRGDMLLIQGWRAIVANHCAVYLGDGLMLHHPPKRISTIQPYLAKRGYFHTATRAILRHPSLKLKAT